jgi:hypothetical protein
MPMSAWPSLDDLIWLFEAEPAIEHEDLGYPTAAATFTTTRGVTLVECTVEPYMNSISIRFVEQSEERLRLHLWGSVEEVHVDRHGSGEALVASMVDRVPFHALRLEMKPSPRITWSAVAPWAPGSSF